MSTQVTNQDQQQSNHNQTSFNQKDTHEEKQCKNTESQAGSSPQANQDNIQNIFQGNDESQKDQENKLKENTQNKQTTQQILELVQFKSQEELKGEFEENQKKLTKLSSNIDDLFKKISSLTEQVTAELEVQPTQSPKKIAEQNKQQPSPKKQTSPIVSKLQQILPPLLSQTPQQYSTGISMRMFETGKTLGYGKFGQVLSCKHKQSQMLFALKKIFKATVQKYNMQDQVLVELQICSKVNHPNIMKSYTAFTDQFHIFLLCQYLMGDKLTKKMGSSEKIVKKIIKQVLNAIQYMHQNGIAHRDLKPENILIDEAGVIKICDFGWSHLQKQGQNMKIVCGTLDYVCPEMVQNQEYGLSVDLWSLGILTYELIYKKAPFRGQNRQETFKNVKSLEIKFPQQPQISKQCKNFIQNLLKKQNQRMGIQQTKNHAFLSQIQPDKQILNQSIDNLFE